MSSLLRKDITLRTISVLLAVFLWLFVLNTANPIKNRTLNIALNVINESTLQDKGIVLKNKNYTRSILVTVRAREEIINKLSETDFTATLDFSRVNSADDKLLTVTDISYIGPEDKNNIMIVEVKPAAVNIDLEKRVQNLFHVEVAATGNLKDNYKIVRITATPESVAIRDVDSLVKTVASVKAVVDVTGLDRDKVFTSNCRVFSKSGDEISSLSKNLNVDIKVEVAKEVSVTPVVKGKPAANFIYGNSSVKPNKVLISGPPEVVSKIDELKTEPVDIENASQNVNLNKLIVLPAGVKLVNSPQQVEVNVGVEQLLTKDLSVTKNDVNFINTEIDNSLQYEVTSPDLMVTVKGEKAVLDKLDVAALKPIVDVNGLREGTYKLPLKVTLNGTAKLMQDYTVDVKVSKRGDAGVQ